ncbi:hypothetical protein ET475_00695 [Microbacterium protaetiae]|uniref:Uncharacterized protein n=1 Tax=Microbacterium protaetiae TaxID=2509458 RepID=A0A4P6EF10_9MICO|nr:hypothetical protein [Microbacterium protaetiae]QAY58667.1 hypothetical protein ET475_00695 [Microbacterium protaetiae]
MIFGIWPGVVNADLIDFRPLDCPPEDPARTLQAITELQSDHARFLVRCYRHFGRRAGDRGDAAETPSDPERYLGQGRQIDLVACYQNAVPDPDGFAAFVRQAVRDVARWGGGAVQVGEEPNMPAPQDGGFPGCLDAIAAGVTAAVDERTCLDAEVQIGVNCAGLADPSFWRQLADALGPDRLRDLDYIGLDAFPDVFRRIPEDQLPGAVRFLVESLRRVTTEVGVPERIPIHITETGWPTDRERDEATQARVMLTVATTILDSDLGVTAYEFFGLRDGLTAGTWHSRFGLLHDDYTPKPAFGAVRDLIAARQGGTADARQTKAGPRSRETA